MFGKQTTNSAFTYSLTPSNNNELIRYIDGRGYGNQYNLFTLSNKVQFNSIDLDSIPFLTFKDENTIGDVIEVPCKLSLRLSGLIIQQQCRSAKEWDRIDNITFDQRVFSENFFPSSYTFINGKSNVNDLPKEENEFLALSSQHWFKFQPRFIGSEHISGNNISFGTFSTTSNDTINLQIINTSGEISGTSNYTIIGKNLKFLSHSELSLGGSKYYNDFQSMKILQNSVKSWKTTFQDTKYDGFTIYGDYSPNNKIIGEPYLNISSTIHLYESYGTGDNLIETEHLAAVVKVAEDNKNVNNVTNINDYLEGKQEIKLKNYCFDFKDGSISRISGTLSSLQIDFYGELKLDDLGKAGFIDLTIDPLHISKIDSLHTMNYELSGGYDSSTKIVSTIGLKKGSDGKNILSQTGEMKIRGTYILLNGYYGNNEQDVIFDENAKNVNDSQNFLDLGTKGTITSIKSAEIRLSNDGILSGHIIYDFSNLLLDKVESEKIQLHHVNLPAPILTNIGVSFTDNQKENLDRNGFYPVNDNIWRREVAFNSNINSCIDLTKKVKNINSLRIYSSLIPNPTMNGKVVPLFDDNNQLSGFFIELKLDKITTFEMAGLRMYVDNPREILLENQDMLSSYRRNIGLLSAANDLESTQLLPGVDSQPEEFNQYARVGDTVISGNVQAAYNYVSTSGITINEPKINGTIPYVGVVKHIFNPVDDDLFQLEVVTKNAGEEFKKKLYYVNKPVDKWYNLALYRYNKTNEAGTDQSSKIGFILSDVDQDNIVNITSRAEEIFPCQVTNDTIIDGLNVKFDLLNNNYSRNWKSTLFNSNGSLYKWQSLYDITFEKCERTQWDCKYSNDPKLLAYENYYVTETDFNKKTRKNIDLFNIGNSSFSEINSTFNNKVGIIKLFANKELESELSRGIYKTVEESQKGAKDEIGRPAFYNLYTLGFSTPSSFSQLLTSTGTLNEYYNYDLGNKINISEYSLLNNDLNNGDGDIYINGPSSVFELLFNNYPAKISVNDNYDHSIVKYKTPREVLPKIRSTEIEAKNIMIVMSPNLTQFKDNDDTDLSPSYNESYNESLDAVNGYIEFFGNPQHRMPPVSYSNLLLSSEYATFIYNNCETYNAIDFSDSYIDNDVLIKNFENNPTTVAYVWGNSKVTRSEHLYDGSVKNTKLIWNQYNSNEYVCELGSIYNYYDAKVTASTTSIEVGSIVERQCSMMPILTSPFNYEKRSKESGLIKVNDTIIATAALGYNAGGLPVNSILTYNDEEGLEIDSTKKQYIYLSQDSDTTCKLKSTVQKSVFVDSITQNIASLPENYEFLPNPTISIKASEQTDDGLETLMGGNLSENLASNENVNKFMFGTERTGNYNFICYSNAARITNRTNSIQYYKYYHKGDANNLGNKIETINESQSDYVPNVLFIGNIFAFPFINENGSVIKEGLNVFYDENEQNTLETILTSGNLDLENLKLNTYPCFGYDGTIYSSQGLQEYVNSNYIIGSDPHETYRDYVNNYISDAKNNNIEIAPEIGVIWKDSLGITDVDTYKSDISLNLSKIANGRSCVFDEYFGVNLSSVRFKIDSNDRATLPIWIKILILKYDYYNNVFKWIEDDDLNIDIRSFYEKYLTYNVADVPTIEDKSVRINCSNDAIYLEKIFINDSTNLTKNVYGVKFKIMQILPQGQTFTSCKISKIKIYASNILNSNGFARTVQDVYVNKAEAAYENSYSFNCSEYIWRLPNQAGEWEEVLKDLKYRKENKELQGFEEQGFDLISGRIQDIINKESSTSNIEFEKINLGNNKHKPVISKGGQNLSVIASYYIAPEMNAGKDITEVLSDNYLVDSNISISWKYIDYVYISYSCNSFNARELLDIYFGNKIFEAVKAKLNANVENLNATNSRYHFSGGIAVTKSYEKKTTTNMKAFEWRQNIDVTTINQYKDVYKTTTTTTNSYNLTQWDRYYYDDYTTYKHYIHEWGRRRHTYGHEEYDVAVGGYSVLNHIEKMGTVSQTNSRTTSSTVRTSHTLINSSSTEQYSGQTLQNVKYSSVDNWISEFGPTEIKYRIN